MDRGHRWHAAVYDRLDAIAQRGWLGDRRRLLVADAAGTVVEIGAGTGGNLPHYRDAEDLILTEPDPAMRRRLTGRLNLARTRVEVLAAPADALPLPDASADVVVSALVLCTVPDVPAALAEVRRVLRPGGQLRLLEHVRAEGRMGHVQDVLRPVWSVFAAGCQLNRRTLAEVEAGGFTLTRVEDVRPPAGLGPSLLPMVQATARS
jgi:ubiquinone/menaquinone biosynthesis C-methylase UbiE